MTPNMSRISSKIPPVSNPDPSHMLRIFSQAPLRPPATPASSPSVPPPVKAEEGGADAWLLLRGGLRGDVVEFYGWTPTKSFWPQGIVIDCNCMG